jgi:hypothetical protein
MAKKKPDSGNLPSLVIEYRVPRGKASTALTKRHALEDWLDALLRKHKLGDCDGGSIGTGTMEVFCDVTDYAKAKALVVKAIKATPYADFERIYKVAAEKPEPKPKGKAVSLRKGDCVALRDGRTYGAAYVADVDPNGNHIVVTLDHLEKARPDLAAFRKMKALVLTHHHWEGQVEVTVEDRPTKAVLARIEVVGNAALKLRNVDVGRHHGSWVNWKQKPDRITREINRETAGYRDLGAGKYLAYSGGEWCLAPQVKMQRRWDAKQAKKAKP